MFYAQFVLSKKAPLAKIWLAAHWEKKLSKANIFDVDIESSVENILNPEAKMALRTSGHLMLGVVRIHNKKAKYLLADCSEAFVKIKMAFRPGQESSGVDLPEQNSQAVFNAITLPDVFADFDTSLGDFSDFQIPDNFMINQSRVDEITLKEDINPSKFPTLENDGFGDIPFNDQETLRSGGTFEAPFLNLRGANMSSLLLDKNTSLLTPVNSVMDFEKDGFNLPSEMMDTAFDPPSVMPPSVLNDDNDANAMQPNVEQPSILGNQSSVTEGDQTTLLHTSANAFVLEPIETNAKDSKVKKKRKLIIDDNIKIQAAVMKAQMEDTSDIVTQLDMAPPTKKLMLWKETGGVDKLFSLPARQTLANPLQSNYARNLHTESAEGPTDRLSKEQIHDETTEQLRDQSSRRVRDIVGPKSPKRSANISNIPSVQSAQMFNEPATPALANNVSLNIDPPTPYIEAPSMHGGDFAAPSMQNDFHNEDDLFGNFAAGSPDSYCDPGSVGGPGSVGSVVDSADDGIFDADCDSPDELGDDETAEEQEERRWNKRTQQMVSILGRNLLSKDYISFKAISAVNNRKQAAAKFYTLLVLRKHTAIEVDQMQAFSDIIISKGPEFNTISLTC